MDKTNAVFTKRILSTRVSGDMSWAWGNKVIMEETWLDIIYKE